MEDISLLNSKKISIKWHKYSFPPARYVLGVLGFLAVANCYNQRFCLSLAITEMVTSGARDETRLHPIVCDLKHAIPLRTNGTPQKYRKGKLKWSEQTQGLVLSGFLYGYVILQIPGGLLANKFGGKYTLEVSLIISSICTLISPITATSLDALGFFILRVIMGCAQGLMYPSVNVLLARWSVPRERGRLGSLVYAGTYFGCMLAMGMSCLLINLGGWPLVFYTSGTIGLIWVIFWHTLCYDDPSSHPFISEHEKEFLQAEIEHLTVEKQNLPPTPWRGILTSVPVWSLAIAQTGYSWGQNAILTDLPKFFKSALGLSITQNGLWSTLPYTLMWITAIATGHFADWLINHKDIPVTIVRKLFFLIAVAGPAIGIVVLTFATENMMVIMILTLGLGMVGALAPSLKMIPLDLSPNYASIIVAIVGCLGSLSGAATPYLIGILTPSGNFKEWRVVFIVTLTIMVPTSLVFIIFGSSELQPWNDPREWWTSLKENKMKIKSQES